jgi:hypothetical protein
MNTGQVYDLFRSLIDEPDQTFLTEAQAQTMLDLGYREFRQTVTDIDTEVYSTRFFINPTGSSFDLAGTLFASAAVPATNAAQRIIRIGRVDSAANDGLSYYLVPTQNPVQVENMEGDYCLSGTSLVFSTTMNGTTLRIEYIPESTITPASWATGNATFIDNLTAAHPLIALYAARYYMIRDGAPNTILLAQLETKERGLKEYLTVGRATDGSHYIAPQIGYSQVVTV